MLPVLSDRPPCEDDVDIFNKIFGFYMHLEDDSVESAKIVKAMECKDYTAITRGIKIGLLHLMFGTD
ncbi:hypothetical protein L2E82_45541 [Cichorium intybus]|uniref:Uncharacterized protein n=1 Tax=Cichorium intybus TaxID=13427 RepID=A0ACB8ZXN9_CICIN|nr:hypothetical protein L2E82_45541 [Cichorium intybus]